jgi:catechol 2,3-dioxygenase-like lactoylglutathione lyase family enzyme
MFMSVNAPSTQSPAVGNFKLRPILLAVVLLPAFAAHQARSNPAENPPPLAVSGIGGVTYLTSDMAAMRQFYGQGAGFAEVQNGLGPTRFAVGASQWIEFQPVPKADWPRRLQYVTLVAPRPEEIERALIARGIPTEWIQSNTNERVLQLEDPAGNRIRVAQPWIAPAVPSGSATAFSAHLQHFGFAVARSQAQATMAFYRDTLGWPEVVRGNGPDGRLNMVKYRLPGPRNEFIELILYDPPLNKWAAGAFDHVNFEVGDIDEAYRVLHRGGIATQDRHLPKVNAERLWAIDIIDPELTRMEVQVLAPAKEAIGTVSAVGNEREKPLFDGRTLAGWEGNTDNWRFEDGVIVAGALDRRQPHNEFLATTADFGNFDLRLQYKVEGTGGFVNGGVQFWSQRVPGNFEVSGFQADLGADTDGNLYDESRRNRNLATAPADVRGRVLRPGAWNDYRVRAEGAHIQIWLNGVKTVDYTEGDSGIPLHGKFALQIHGGANTKVSYRGLTIETLPERAKDDK